jgi:hypothetical protein
MEVPTPRPLELNPLSFIHVRSAAYSAPQALPFSGAVPGACTPQRVRPNASLILEADYNIGRKRKQTGVMSQFEFSGY